MSNCLGIYIGKNIIKYAKVSRDNNSIKIITQGIKIYTDIKETLNQIITETDSTKTPISVSLDKENYDYFEMSALLAKKDLTKAINMEFQSICNEKGENVDVLEKRYALINNENEKNKVKVIYVSEDKANLNQIQNNFAGEKLISAVPISFAIANIVPINPRENVAVVNIEEDTSVTIIQGEKINEIKKINLGMSNILDNITNKENSYVKAYEICKNTTIYTMDRSNIDDESNEYLPDIIPTLYDIGIRIKNIIDETARKIDKIYITGTAAVINNIDLYFNEVIEREDCEILKPFFLEDNAQVSIKDCIEVNSAIALSLQGLKFGLKDINFVKTSNKKIELSNIFQKGSGSSTAKSFNMPELNGNVFPMVKYAFTIVLSAFIIYSAFSFWVYNEIQNKDVQLQAVIEDTQEQIDKIEQDTQKINIKSTEYSDLINSLKDAKNSVDARSTYKYSIPNLLSDIARVIPKGVQITSIENPTDKKIIIAAQSISYEQLAYFKSVLRQEGILQPDTIVSSQAIKTGDDEMTIDSEDKNDQTVEYVRKVIKVVIEGELK